jgi:hypothetical protein
MVVQLSLFTSAPKKSLTIRTMKITLLTMALVASVTQGEVLTLTGENYKEMTAGKLRLAARFSLNASRHVACNNTV